MSGSGLIYAVIALLWAAVLIPMWLRSHDTSTENRSAERFGQAMRVLSGRAGAEDDDSFDESASVTPEVRRSSVEASDDRPETRVGQRPAATRPRREVSAPRDSAAPRPASSRPATRRSVPRRPSLARRRARTLLVLLGLAAVLVVGAVFGPVPWWAPVLVLLTVAAFVVHLRLQVLRSQTRRRPAQRPVSSPRSSQRVAANKPAPASTATDEVNESAAAPAAASRSRSWRTVFAEDSSRAVVVESKGSVTAEAGQPGKDKAETEGDEEWRPNPLPLPTYVTAPKATRPIRVIDLTTPGAWSSGRVIDDESIADEDLLAAEVRTEELDALLEHEAAPSAKTDDGSQRAVGD